MNVLIKEKQDLTTVQISDLFDVINGLWMGKSTDRVDCKVIRNTNFRNSGFLNFDNIANISVDKKALSSRELTKGDIIIEKSGGSDTQPVGRIVLFDLDENNYSFSNFTSCLRPKDKRYNSKYLFYCLYSIWLFGKTKEMQRQTTGIRNLDMNAYMASKIFIPPIKQQEKIAEILTAVDADIENTDRTIKQTENLKKGLMQQLLTRGIGHTKFRQTEIGVVPEDWTVQSIGQWCKITTGGTPSRRDPSNYTGSVLWVKSTEIRYNTIYETEEHISEKALKESATKVILAGSILVAMYGQGVTRGKCAILGCDATTNQAVAALQPTKKLLNQYLFYFLQFNYENIRNLSHGGNQLNLNTQLIKKIQFPMPQFNEQEKIAQILQSIDNQIEINKQLKAQQKKLKHGLMQDLLRGRIAKEDDEDNY